MRSSRRDPYWDVDGDAVRRQRRRSSLVAVIAFFVSFVALAGAAVAWAATVGPAPAGLAGIGDYASAAGDMVRRGGLAVGTIGSILVLSTVVAGIAMVARMLRGPTNACSRRIGCAQAPRHLRGDATPDGVPNAASVPRFRHASRSMTPDTWIARRR
jgi:hypothetical protein